QLKQEANAWLARWLANLVLEARRDRFTQFLASDSWVVPVPLHWWRELRRGYNQSDALARGLAKGLGLPVRHPLRRVMATHRLAGLGPTERRELMRNAFRIRRGARLDQRSVLLVDDVLTTGATAGAAARVLKHAGAAHVTIVVIGRAEKTTL